MEPAEPCRVASNASHVRELGVSSAYRNAQGPQLPVDGVFQLRICQSRLSVMTLANDGGLWHQQDGCAAFWVVTNDCIVI